MEHYKYVLLDTNNNVAHYPYSIPDLKKDNPSTSFPDVITDQELLLWNVHKVRLVNPVTFDKNSETCEEVMPEFVDNEWVQRWTIRDLTAEELTTHIKNIRDEYIRLTQERLDTFAQTRGYDNILSVCTYASSSSSTFRVEGEYGVIARDDTWNKLYHLLELVESGLIPVPNSYEEIENLLPALTWPE